MLLGVQPEHLARVLAEGRGGPPHRARRAEQARHAAPASRPGRAPGARGPHERRRGAAKCGSAAMSSAASTARTRARRLARRRRASPIHLLARARRDPRADHAVELVARARRDLARAARRGAGPRGAQDAAGPPTRRGAARASACRRSGPVQRELDASCASRGSPCAVYAVLAALEPARQAHAVWSWIVDARPSSQCARRRQLRSTGSCAAADPRAARAAQPRRRPTARPPAASAASRRRGQARFGGPPARPSGARSRERLASVPSRAARRAGRSGRSR